MVFVLTLLMLVAMVWFFFRLKPAGFGLDYYSIIFYFYTLMGVIGSYVIYFDIVDFTYFVRVFAEKEDVKLYGLFMVVYGGFAIFFMIFMLESVWSDKGYRKVWLQYTQKRTFPDNKISLLWLLLIFFISTSYYLYSIHPSPFYEALRGADALTVAVRRNDVTMNYTGIGILKTLSIATAQILMIFTFARFLTRKKYAELIFVWMLCSLILLANAEKGPLVTAMLGCLVVYCYMGFKLSTKVVLVCSVLGGGALFSIYVLIMGVSSVYDFTYILFERVFIAQTVAPFLSVDYYQDSNYLYFSSMEPSIFRFIHPEREFRASEVFMASYYPGMLAQGGWNVNGIYIHEAFSNFGWLGVFLAPFYVGLVSFIFVKFFTLFKKNYVNVSIFAFLSINVAPLLTSFNQFILNTALLLCLLAIFLPVNFIRRLT